MYRLRFPIWPLDPYSDSVSGSRHFNLRNCSLAKITTTNFYQTAIFFIKIFDHISPAWKKRLDPIPHTVFLRFFKNVLMLMKKLSTVKGTKSYVMFCLPSKIFIRIRINYKKWNPDSHQLAWNRHIGAIGSCFSHSFVVPVAPA